MSDKCKVCGQDQNVEEPVKLSNLIQAQMYIAEALYGNQDESIAKMQELVTLLGIKEDETVLDAVFRYIGERQKLETKLNSLINSTQYSKITDFCDLMTYEEFLSGCKHGPVFTDYDGIGYLVVTLEDGTMRETNIEASPSTFLGYEKDEMLRYWDVDPKLVTHVAWYNK